MKKLKVKKRLKRSIKKLRKPIPTVKLEIFCVTFVSFHSFLPFFRLILRAVHDDGYCKDQEKEKSEASF